METRIKFGCRYIIIVIIQLYNPLSDTLTECIVNTDERIFLSLSHYLKDKSNRFLPKAMR